MTALRATPEECLAVVREEFGDLPLDIDSAIQEVKSIRGRLLAIESMLQDAYEKANSAASIAGLGDMAPSHLDRLRNPAATAHLEDEAVALLSRWLDAERAGNPMRENARNLAYSETRAFLDKRRRVMDQLAKSDAALPAEGAVL